jgi:hypothetical protein
MQTNTKEKIEKSLSSLLVTDEVLRVIIASNSEKFHEKVWIKITAGVP